MFSSSPPIPLSLPPPLPTFQTSNDGLHLVPFGVEIPNRVFVGGCPYNMTEKELGDFFSRFGLVKDSKIVFDKATGKSLGYGFVTYVSEEDAVNVYSKGSIYYNEKKLNVSKAVRKHGGQYPRPNQEFLNGNQLYVHPNGYLLSQHEGAWHFQTPTPHTQPVKPCYALYLGPNMQPQPTGTYSMQSPTFAPMAPTPFLASPTYHNPPPHTPTIYTPQGHTPSIRQIITTNQTPDELDEPIENAVTVNEIESPNSQESPDISEKESFENGFENLTLNDSAYASDDKSQSNNQSESSNSPTSEPQHTLDLDSIFDERRSPGQRKKYTRKRNQHFQSPTAPYGNQHIGLLPHPTPVGYQVGTYVPM